MSTALFINGVFEATLAEIEKTQNASSGKRCYLQPYASGRIRFLAESLPSPDDPVTLYLSLTDSLPYVSYSAKIVEWQDKRELVSDQARAASPAATRCHGGRTSPLPNSSPHDRRS